MLEADGREAAIYARGERQRSLRAGERWTLARRVRTVVSIRSTSSSLARGFGATRSSTLAEIGALNAFGYDRRAALWQAERAVRPAGELFENLQFTIRFAIRERQMRNGDATISLMRIARCRSSRRTRYCQQSHEVRIVNSQL